MKKNVFLILALVAIFSFTVTKVNAQDNKFSLGGGFGYATGIKSVGFFGKGQYQFTSQWEATASFTYFLPSEINGIDYQLSALDLDGHYVFYNDEYKLASYMLSGIDVLFGKSHYTVLGSDYYDSGSTLGINIGAGLRYQLSERLALNPELKYVVSFGENSYLSLSVGLLFNF